MIVLSMFDESGNALRPWAEHGATCFAVDWSNEERTEHCGHGGSITYLNRDLSKRDVLLELAALRPSFLMGFPDCTHMAVSGARHFASKLAADPWVHINAVALARTVETVGNAAGCAWMAENPRSILSTRWRKPDYKFDPCMYGGYLPEDDIHPRWPRFITARDAYTKDTWLWTGGNYVMPKRKFVTPYVVEYENGNRGSQGWSQLGGKSKKTKQIRSETPRGFAIANWAANWYNAMKHSVDKRTSQT